MSSDFLIGGHVSSAGGISNALVRAQGIGANCVQIFSGSPRVWARSLITDAEISKYNQKKVELGIKRTVIHALYLLNLASDNPELREKSRRVIEYDLNLDAVIGGSGVVVHLGSHLGRGFDAVKNQLTEEIKNILSHTPESSTFLIENSAGQKGKIASDLAEIQRLISQVGSKRLGWCLDTCHAFAAGYALENDKEATSKNIFNVIDELKLWETLRVIHVNDSRDPFDSGRDRHQNIGEGSIGDARFTSFFTNPQIRSLPLILEVPGMDGESGPDAANVMRIQKLLKN